MNELQLRLVVRLCINLLPITPIIISVFFFPVKKKCRWKAFLGFFSIFSRAKNLFSRPLFGQILTFFTPTFVFHAHFFGFFHGEQMSFHGQKLCSYTENFIVLTGIFCIFFHGHHFDFHGHTFRKIFTGSFQFSRAFFRGFFRYFHVHLFFSRAQFPIFSRVKLFFSRVKKKHWHTHTLINNIKQTPPPPHHTPPQPTNKKQTTYQTQPSYSQYILHYYTYYIPITTINLYSTKFN